jgi:hypothetical protein
MSYRTELPNNLLRDKIAAYLASRYGEKPGIKDMRDAETILGMIADFTQPTEQSQDALPDSIAKPVTNEEIAAEAETNDGFQRSFTLGAQWMRLQLWPRIRWLLEHWIVQAESDGVAMIATQRRRQFRSHTDTEDDGLTDGQMAKSALVKLENALAKPSGAASYAMLLVKAGAMIAAELDRVNRANGGKLAERLPGE